MSASSTLFLDNLFLVVLAIKVSLLADTVLSATPPRLGQFRRSTDGATHFQLQGETGSNYVVQTSVDLVNWSTLAALKANSGTIEVVHPEATNYLRLFYRARTARNDEVSNSLKVTITTDTTRSASVLIPVTGGTLTLTNSDGVICRLTIPANALLSEETISMSAVKSVGGLPLSGGLLAAVQLSPEGLALFQPATLTFSFPNTVAASEATSFAYRRQGDEFHLTPDTIAGNTVTLKLLHFSGAGVGRGTDAERQAQQGRIPTDPADRADQRARDVLDQIRKNGGTATPGDLGNLESIYRDEYLASIKTALDSGQSSCQSGQNAVSAFLNWYRNLVLFDLEDRFTAEINSALNSAAAIFRHCADELHQRCVDNHDPAVVQNLLALARQVILLGLDDKDPGILKFIGDKVQGCLRFTLDFDSMTEFTDDNGTRYNAHVHAIVPLSLPDLSSILEGPTGQGPLQYVTATVVANLGDDCSYVINAQTSVLNVSSLSFDLNIKTDAKPSLTLQLSVPRPTVQLTTSCPDVPGLTIPFEIWTIAFTQAHSDDFRAGLFVRDWEFVGGQIFARKLYRSTTTFESAVFTDSSTFELRHVPK